ncbi:type II toxin-antitoxin system VapC family toxin [bacterium]|nr:type II toxin-antitoxin system VapC family toxin [bacterium]
MILLDANLLLYAHNEEAEQHENARDYLEKMLNSEEWVGMPWTSIWAFLRIATHRQIFRTPFTPEEACEIVSSWLECPNVRPLGPGQRHWVYLQKLIRSGQVQGALVMDAALAALAQEQGAEIETCDRDFARFEGVAWRNPLKPR